MKITDIRPAMHNEERVNVWVDGEYRFSLLLSQVVDLQLKVGAEIDSVTLKQYEKESEFGKIYMRTLEWSLARPRSVREVVDYLKRVRKRRRKDGSIQILKYEPEMVERVAALLQEKKYVNDVSFARWFIENRSARKGASLKKLTLELRQKGVTEEIIDGVMTSGARNEREEINKIVARKSGKMSADKLAIYLARQGFSWDLIREVCAQDETG